jgi:prolipoprotein diacylglyceryltransferase
MSWPVRDNRSPYFYIWEGGIAVYGAVIGGALGVYLYCRIPQAQLRRADGHHRAGLALAQAIGRWGNYFNRERTAP